MIAKGIKDNVNYKVVGRVGDGTLLLGNNFRFYIMDQKHQLVRAQTKSVSRSARNHIEDWLESHSSWFIHHGAYPDSDSIVNVGINWTKYQTQTVTQRIYYDVRYTIFEIDGDVYVQGIKYSNKDVQYEGGDITSRSISLSGYDGSMYDAILYDGGTNPHVDLWRGDIPVSEFYSAFDSPNWSDSGNFPKEIRAKIFSKNFVGY